MLMPRVLSTIRTRGAAGREASMKLHAQMTRGGDKEAAAAAETSSGGTDEGKHRLTAGWCHAHSS